MTDEKMPDVPMKGQEQKDEAKSARPKRKSRKSRSPQKGRKDVQRRRPGPTPRTLPFEKVKTLLQSKWLAISGRVRLPMNNLVLLELFNVAARQMSSPLEQGQTGDIYAAAVNRLRSLQSGVIKEPNFCAIRVDTSDLLFEEDNHVGTVIFL